MKTILKVLIILALGLIAFSPRMSQSYNQGSNPSIYPIYNGKSPLIHWKQFDLNTKDIKDVLVDLGSGCKGLAKNTIQKTSEYAVKKEGKTKKAADLSSQLLANSCMRANKALVCKNESCLKKCTISCMDNIEKQLSDKK